MSGTALRESESASESESESTASTSRIETSIFFPIEPRLRVTPSYSALPSLNSLIYITDSIIPVLETWAGTDSDENNVDHSEEESSAPVMAAVDFGHEESDDDNDSRSDVRWQCDCYQGGCGVTDGDVCDCVSTFGNFYAYSGNDDEPGRLNLDALPENMPLVECGPSCPCGLECLNRVTQYGLKVPIHVKPTVDTIGLGAYFDPPDDPVEGKASPIASSSRSVLQRGTFICLYAGEYLSTEEANERWSSTPRQQTGEGNYILTLRLPGRIIHIDPRHKGNVGRFFNHSCDPTCVVHVVRWGGDSIWPRAAIFAKRDILPGEELTYDYANASGVSVVEEEFRKGAGEGLTQCLCGAGNCRGWMPFDPDV